MRDRFSRFFSFLAKPIRCGEVTLAKHVYRDLPEKSLLLFDIGFCAYTLMRQVIDGKSDFLGRAKMNRRFKKTKVLSDGSYLSKIYATDYDRIHDRNGTVVRVIEYTLDDPQRVGHGEKHRLVTTLLDEHEHPAETLIVLYHERWEEEVAIETTFQEMRAHLGLETPHGWHRNTVLRMAPCLFLLYTIILTFYDTMPHSSPHLQTRSWVGKEFITFSDMILSVRHHLWMNWVFEQVPDGVGVRKLPPTIRKLPDFGLKQAA